MIFQAKHIQQIINLEKTQTRRISEKYKIGHIYCIQGHYGDLGLRTCKIRILGKRIEYSPFMISIYDAKAEGGYTPGEYEELWTRMYGKKRIPFRVAYTFELLEV